MEYVHEQRFLFFLFFFYIDCIKTIYIRGSLSNLWESVHIVVKNFI